jgi:hypothetical protein
MNMNQESNTLTIIARMCQLLPFIRGFQSSSCYRLFLTAASIATLVMFSKCQLQQEQSFLKRLRANQLENNSVSLMGSESSLPFSQERTIFIT